MDLFSAKNFSIYYKVKKDFAIAVEDLTFGIRSGEFFVIVGGSGSGKTSLLRSLFDASGGVTRGELLLNNAPVDTVNMAEQNFAYVSQYYSLNANMTVYDNIAFPLRNMKTDPAEVDRRVRSIAQAFGIYPLLTRKPRQISGGQKQKVHERLHCTIVFVTHDLNEAFDLADRIMVLDGGRLAELGTPEELRVHHESKLLKEFFRR